MNHWKDHPMRRVATRLLLAAPMTVAMVAGVIAASPAAAAPRGETTLSASEPAASVAGTICFAAQADIHAAVGECVDPAPNVEYRVVGLCEARNTGAHYLRFSAWTSSFDEAVVFCDVLLLPDFIIDWDTETKVRPLDPPVIHSLSCQVSDWTQLTCTLSASSNWTQIRWRVDGKHRIQWNNRTFVQGGCPGFESGHSIMLELRAVPVKVTVSNSDGTVSRQVSPTCIVKG